MLKINIIQYLSVLLFVFLCAACSARKSNLNSKGIITNYTQCSLPKDQGTGSLVGPWNSRPISIVFDQEFYLSNDGAVLTSLRNAVQTWNSWSSLRGFSIFSIINDSSSGISGGEHIPTNATCEQSAYTSGYTTAVGVWKIQASGDGKNARDSCGTEKQKILADTVQGQTDWIVYNGKITAASILLNFDAWNAPGKVKVDVESLLLHELGHVVGLLHSCNPGTGDATASVNCSLASASYISAVMFPALYSDQLRRSLGQNDYNRVNCLY